MPAKQVTSFPLHAQDSKKRRVLLASLFAAGDDLSRRSGQNLTKAPSTERRNTSPYREGALDLPAGHYPISANFLKNR